MEAVGAVVITLWLCAVAWIIAHGWGAYKRHRRRQERRQQTLDKAFERHRLDERSDWRYD